MNNKQVLDISWNTIIKISFSLLVFYLIYLIRDIIILTFFAFIISILFEPLIEFLNKRGINRVIATFLSFVLIFGFFGFSLYLISLAFAKELTSSDNIFSKYFNIISSGLKSIGFPAFDSLQEFISSFNEILKKTSSGIFSALSVVFGGMFSWIYVFFLSFFFALEERSVEKTIRLILPKRYEENVLEIWHKSRNKIISWFGARILACVFVGFATFVCLKIFKVDYAVTLSLFAGVTNIVPFLGPFLAGIVMTFFVLLDDWAKASFVLVAFILIQQIENNIISPFLTKKIIGLPPVLVLLSITIGGKLFGILGAMLILPIVGIIYDFLVEYFSKSKKQEEFEQ
jgi:predicted PurR-regulated permease PerM